MDRKPVSTLSLVLFSSCVLPRCSAKSAANPSTETVHLNSRLKGTSNSGSNVGWLVPTCRCARKRNSGSEGTS
ncbi:uncharacterized protein BDZ99DRAFT_468667 [Mytilinidion resinicola]|uniref:Secreted protein n=1 Tax=Mytilinidion resinicola TaxID=574789 RepID=A0A6A6Y298_9PEZI|nr:uncharacterized protein BDZ99DRAFT_468667 [Mytilinidion resinicola]KAF2802678.1 hypothetical protein BDZ99DRAFT_468667 [Mytilinidion resinicola]